MVPAAGIASAGSRVCRYSARLTSSEFSVSSAHRGVSSRAASVVCQFVPNSVRRRSFAAVRLRDFLRSSRGGLEQPRRLSTVTESKSSMREVAASESPPSMLKAETAVGEAKAAVVKAETSVVKAEAAVEEAKADWVSRPDDSFLKLIYQQALDDLRARHSELAERQQELAEQRRTLNQLLLRTSGSASALSQDDETSSVVQALASFGGSDEDWFAAGARDIGAGVWSISQGPFLFLQTGMPLFVRPCVRQLFQDVVVPALNWGRNHTSVIIMGTPGTGKSVSQNYFLAQFLHENRRRVAEGKPWRPIVLRDVKNAPSSAILIREDGGAYELSSNTKEYLDLKHDASVLRLVDTGSDGNTIPGIDSISGFTVITASPAAVSKELWNKGLGAINAVAPPWTMEEVLAARKAMEAQGYTTEAEVIDRFNSSGGVLRYIFGDVDFRDGYDAEREDLLAKEGLEGLRRMTSTPIGYMSKVVHRIFHAVPEAITDPESVSRFESFKSQGKWSKAMHGFSPWNPRTTTYQFASPLVREQVLALLRAKELKERISFATQVLGIPTSRKLGGEAFQELFHQSLGSESTLQLTQLFRADAEASEASDSPPLVVYVALPPLQLEHFDSADFATAQPNCLRVPRAPNFAAVDSGVVHDGVLYLFQVTVQKSGHAVIADSLLKHVKAWKELNDNIRECRLVFVVPPDCASSYVKEQKLTRSGAKKLSEEMRSEIEKDLQSCGVTLSQWRCKFALDTLGSGLRGGEST